MRIRYTGQQATEHRGTGLWAPGEARDVDDAVAAGLVAGGAFVVDGETAEEWTTSSEPTGWTVAPEHNDKIDFAEPKKKRARKGREE